MEIFQQIIFLAILGLAVFLFSRKVMGIKRNISLGYDEKLTDQPLKRWKNVFLLALGQKKMFKNPLVAILHLFIYLGFIIINIEILEIISDGIFGSHRLFQPLIPNLYPFLINIFELLALSVIVVCIIFLARRNLVHVKRLWSTDIKGWPSKDANFILIVEIVLMLLFLTMNASDTMLQELGIVHYADHRTGFFIVSSLFIPLLKVLDANSLVILERSCWWLHIIGIFSFLNYLPWSKHLHIILAFPNAFFARLTPPGKMQNMVAVQNEVIYAFQPELAPTTPQEGPQQKFGAKDIQDLSWKNILDAYSCTECGRCSDECPATQTGKLLSPRKIMMQTRDRAEEIGRNIDKNRTFIEDNKSLLNDYISEEELRACTSCNACVEACPVSINPLDIILQMRRYLVMEKSIAPQEWTMMFGNIENNYAPWKFSPDQRADWAKNDKN
jgi:heterodisulfide reductase subunit C